MNPQLGAAVAAPFQEFPNKLVMLQESPFFIFSPCNFYFLAQRVLFGFFVKHFLIVAPAQPPIGQSWS